MDKIYYFIIFVLFSESVFAENPLIINEDFTKEYLGRHVEYFIDDEKLLTIDEIIKGDNVDFIQNNTRITCFGKRKNNSVWFRLTIDNKTNRPIKIFFESKSTDIGTTSLFIPKKGKVEQYKTGDHVAWVDWSIKSNYPAFSVEQPIGKKIYYFNVVSARSLAFNLIAKTETIFYKNKEFRYIFIYSPFITIMILLFLINLIFFFLQKKISFLILALFSLVAMQNALYFEGILHRYIFPSNAQWQNTFNIQCQLLLTLLIATFARFFTPTSKNFKYLTDSICLIALILISGYFLMLSIDSTNLLLLGIYWFVIVCFCSVSLMIAYIWWVIDIRKRVLLPGFYITAGTIQILCLAIITMRFQFFFNFEFTYWISETFIILWPAHFGFCISALIVTLSFIAQVGFNLNLDTKKEAKPKIDYYQKIEKQESLNTFFVNFLTHEISQPMQVIQGLVKFLSTEHDLKNTYKDCFEDLKEATDEVFSLTNDFLEHTRYESYKIPLNIEPIKIKLLVNDVIDSLCDINIQKYNHEIIIEFLKVDDLIIEADKDKIRRVLLNVITNAFKYTPNSGKIVITCEQKKENCIKISIADNGDGIPLEIQQNIFDSFFQGKNPRKIVGGMGVGLSIVKYIVELHGGEINPISPPPKKLLKKLDIQNNKKEGTVFEIILPIRRNRTRIN